MKTCTKCRVEKPVDAYYINSASPDGRYSICRECKYASTRKTPVLPEGKLLCYVCESVKDDTEFRVAGSPRRKRICKSCASIKDKERRKLRDEHFPETVANRKLWHQKQYERTKEERRNLQLLRKFNISLEQYNDILKKQNNVCGICKEPETKKDNRTGLVFNLAVDHDHFCCPGNTSCGKCVRGLLCGNCNVKMGWFETVAEEATTWAKKRVSYE